MSDEESNTAGARGRNRLFVAQLVLVALQLVMLGQQCRAYTQTEARIRADQSLTDATVELRRSTEDAMREIAKVERDVACEAAE